jgi:hypothetical protein
MERFVDRVTLEVIDPDAYLDPDFEFTDLEDARPGDYYCVRVTQLDSGRAWSSPFWVGDREIEPPQGTAGQGLDRLPPSRSVDLPSPAR